MLFQENLPEGWFIAEADESARLHNELQRELPTGHVLKGVPVLVVAHRDCATDDVLCQHQNNVLRFTVVHLTWKMSEEISPKFPLVTVDGCFEDFLKYESMY
jgi:hypothetical protein